MKYLYLFSYLLYSYFSFGDKPPNILWIVGENLKLDLGCYGAKNVKTPNLDRLASQSLEFFQKCIAGKAHKHRHVLISGQHNHRRKIGWTDRIGTC